MTHRQDLERRAARKQLTTMRRHVLVCVDDDCSKGGKLVKRIKKGIAAHGLRATLCATGQLPTSA